MFKRETEKRPTKGSFSLERVVAGRNRAEPAGEERQGERERAKEMTRMDRDKPSGLPDSFSIPLVSERVEWDVFCPESLFLSSSLFLSFSLHTHTHTHTLSLSLSLLP